MLISARDGRVQPAWQVCNGPRGIVGLRWPGLQPAGIRPNSRETALGTDLAQYRISGFLSRCSGWSEWI